MSGSAPPDAGPDIVETSWWLDFAALPDLHWARLQLLSDGSAAILDLDGRTHRFADAEQATRWLGEDEYSRWSDAGDAFWRDECADAGCEPPAGPPSAGSDAELIALMLQRRR